MTSDQQEPSAYWAGLEPSVTDFEKGQWLDLRVVNSEQTHVSGIATFPAV
jgi:hypothetical protein